MQVPPKKTLSRKTQPAKSSRRGIGISRLPAKLPPARLRGADESTAVAESLPTPDGLSLTELAARERFRAGTSADVVL